MKKKFRLYTHLILASTVMIFILTACKFGNTSDNGSKLLQTVNTEANLPVLPEVTSTTQPKIILSTPTLGSSPLATPSSSISADGRHMWILSNTSPVDELRKQLSQGYERILGVAYGNGYWVSTLLRDNREIQYLDMYSTLKEDDLNDLMARGYVISSITRGDDIWIVTYNSTNKPVLQRIMVLNSLSIEDLAPDQKDGYYVTSLVFGEDNWIIVLTKDRDITDQKISILDENVELNSVLNDNSENYFINAVASGNNKIVVVRSSFQSYTEQEIIIADSFQKDFIQDAWFDRYDNIRVFFVNGKWIHVVMK